MEARFRVHGSFPLRSRSVLAVYGAVSSGAVRAGQRVLAPPGLDAPVDAVEFVLVVARRGRAEPALCFRYETEPDLARWQALVPPGTELVLHGPD